MHAFILHVSLIISIIIKVVIAGNNDIFQKKEHSFDKNHNGLKESDVYRLVHPVVLIHGGAGSMPLDQQDSKYEGMKGAVRAGWSALQSTGDAMEAVIAAIKVMEDDPAFNAGRGAKLNILGQVEMDAAVMEGYNMNAGGVASISGIKHPIEAARLVMDNSSHVLIVGEGAYNFTTRRGIQTANDDWLVTERSRELLEQYLREHNITHLDHDSLLNWEELGGTPGHGTVGAVVFDGVGNLAAGTSTGGITGKLPGRVGDSPNIGHGVFADNFSAAISCTGTGETFMKAGVARRIANMVANGLQPEISAAEALQYMKDRVGGNGGAIVLDNQGNIGIQWNSEMMAWAYAKDDFLHYGINRGEDFIEPIDMK